GYPNRGQYPSTARALRLPNTQPVFGNFSLCHGQAGNAEGGELVEGIYDLETYGPEILDVIGRQHQLVAAGRSGQQTVPQRQGTNLLARPPPPPPPFPCPARAA